MKRASAIATLVVLALFGLVVLGALTGCSGNGVTIVLANGGTLSLGAGATYHTPDKGTAYPRLVITDRDDHRERRVVFVSPSTGKEVCKDVPGRALDLGFDIDVRWEFGRCGSTR